MSKNLLYDNKILIIPTNDKPVKIVFECCDVCNEIRTELRKIKDDDMVFKVYKCPNCGIDFVV